MKLIKFLMYKNLKGTFKPLPFTCTRKSSNRYKKPFAFAYSVVLNVRINNETRKELSTHLKSSSLYSL